MNKICSIQGTNGSGKTTIVYDILKKFAHRPIYGVSGPRYPEAYEIDIKQDRPLYVLGSYHTAAGGTDWIGDFDILVMLLNKYTARGHVLFEGLITSGSRGRIGEFLEKYGKDAAVLFINTPLETCIERVNQRRDTKGNKKEFDPRNLIKKYKAVVRTRNHYLNDGIVTVIDTSSEEGADHVLNFIKNTFECPYCRSEGATEDGCDICGSGPAG